MTSVRQPAVETGDCRSRLPCAPERPPSAQLFPFPASNVSSDSLRLAPVCWETCAIKCSEKKQLPATLLRRVVGWSREVGSFHQVQLHESLGKLSGSLLQGYWSNCCMLQSLLSSFFKQKLNEGKREKELSVTLPDLLWLLKRKVIVQLKGILTIAAEPLSKKLYVSSRALNHRQWHPQQHTGLLLGTCSTTIILQWYAKCLSVVCFFFTTLRLTTVTPFVKGCWKYLRWKIYTVVLYLVFLIRQWCNLGNRLYSV